MDFIDSHPLLLLLPLLSSLAGLLGFAFAAAKASRHYALGASLAISLLVALLTFLQSFGGPVYLEGMLLYVSLGILLAQIVAASLLDRARLIGLIGGSVLASFALLSLVIDEAPMVLPLVAGEVWLLCALITASLVGLAGSAWLPIHPARAMRGDQLRAPHFSYVRDAGLLLMAMSFVLVAAGNTEASLSPSFALSAIVAALCPLLLHRGPVRLHLAAEGVLAGCIIAILSAGNSMEAVVYGAVAAVLVQRGERIAGSLRLDDPSRLVGTVLLPAMAGLLLPFTHDLSALADALRWLGASLLIAGVVSLLWLAAKASVGLAAAPARVREGLDFLP